MTLQHLIGRSVSVHYNLHRCRAGGDPQPEESCFVIKDGGMSNRVSGYCRSFVLNDASLIVQPGGLARVRAAGVRAVMAYYTGILTAVDGLIDVPSFMREVGFNPFYNDSFVFKDDGSPVYQAQYILGEGRRTWADDYYQGLRTA